jgi:hypothetical protein
MTITGRKDDETHATTMISKKRRGKIRDKTGLKQRVAGKAAPLAMVAEQRVTHPYGLRTTCHHSLWLYDNTPPLALIKSIVSPLGMVSGHHVTTHDVLILLRIAFLILWGSLPRSFHILVVVHLNARLNATHTI